MKKYITVILSILIFTSAHAGMSKDDKSKPGIVLEFIWQITFYHLVKNLNMA